MAEFDLGSVFNNIVTTRTGFVGGTDPLDTYSFRLVNSNSNFHIALTGMNGDADIRVYRDFNANGVIDSNDSQIASSARSGFRDESIDVSASASNVDIGSYIIEVDPFLSASTNYNLKVAAGATLNEPGKLLPAEQDVGNLTSTRTFSDSLNSNTDIVDTYRFTVTSTRTFNFTSTTTSGNADLRLIQDQNSNLGVDFGDELARSTNFNGTESISRSLSAGTYYLQVFSLAGSANYNLSMS